MLRLNQAVFIDGKKLPYFANCEIVSSQNKFTDTATLTLPNKIVANGGRISDTIQLGSKVEIQLGYFPNLETEFIGYVAQIVPDKTLSILCEDEAYIYKRANVGEDIIEFGTTSKKLIDKIFAAKNISSLKGKYKTIDANIGDWKVSKFATVMDVVKEFQSKLKLNSYFRDSVLFVGAQSDTYEKQTIVCDFQKNMPMGESSLNFKNADAEKIIVRVSAINRKGEITEIFAHYSGSPQKIVFEQTPPVGSINDFVINGQSDITTEQLKELAEIRLQALSFTGAEGSIVMYGTPRAKHGDIARIIDSEIPERNRDYAIVEVIKTFGVGVGYRQTLKLGIAL